MSAGIVNTSDHAYQHGAKSPTAIGVDPDVR